MSFADSHFCVNLLVIFFFYDWLCLDYALDPICRDVRRFANFCHEGFLYGALAIHIKRKFKQGIECRGEFTVIVNISDEESWEVMIVVFMVKWEVKP